MSKEFKFKKEGEPPAEEKKEEEKKEEEEEKKEEGTEKSAPVKKEDESPSEEKKEEEEEEKKEESAEKSAPHYLSKSAIEAIIAKSVADATAPLIRKNAELEKSIAMGTYVQKAATDYGALGDPKSVGPILYDIQKSNLPDATKAELGNLLVRADRLNKEAMPLLTRSLGHNNTALLPADSASGQIERLAKEHIQKSGKPLDLAEARAEIRRLHPDLARAEQEEYNRRLV